MVIAFLILALAMIAGGAWAMVEGYGIIVLERGWALVIAGSVIATGGALLLGLAAALGRLGQTRAELVRLRERLGRAEPGFPEPPPRVDPISSDLLSSGLLAGGGTSADLPTEGAPETRVASLDRDALAAPLTPPAPGAGPLARAPDQTGGGASPSPAGVPREAAAAAGTATAAGAAWIAAMRGRSGDEAPEASRATPMGETRAGGGPAVAAADVPALPPETDRAPDPDAPAEEDAPYATRDPVVPDIATSPAGSRDPTAGTGGGMENPAAAGVDAIAAEAGVGADAGATDAGEGAANVVGTYNSGGNRYVMFSDGSINAETPDGTFRFQSLDELKAFIAAGGERPQEG